MQLELKKYTIGLTFRFFGELFSSKEQGFGNVELKFDKIVKAKNWVHVYACIDQRWSHLPFFVCKLLSFTLGCTSNKIDIHAYLEWAQFSTAFGQICLSKIKGSHTDTHGMLQFYNNSAHSDEIYKLEVRLELIKIKFSIHMQLLRIGTHLYKNMIYRNSSLFCDNYVPQWWVELDDELSWLFTNFKCYQINES